MKLRDKRTGEIRIVNGSYADRIKGTVRIYLADLNKKPVGDAMLPDIMENYEVVERLKTVWDLKPDDVFYVIDDGRVAGGVWGQFDYTRNRDAGDVFLTKKDAEKELARRKAKQVLLRDTKGFKPRLSDGYEHIKVYYTDEGDLATLSDYGLYGDIYFELFADAEASIVAHEKEWKIYLGVEE